jgi:DNA polymerase III alpha subunit
VLGKENVILEIIPQNPKYNPLLAQANEVLWQVHEKTGLPIICASNFHYILQDDQEAFDIARCIKDGKRVYDEDRRKTQGEFSIMSEEDIRTACENNGFVASQIDEMIATTEKVATMINLQIPL